MVYKRYINGRPYYYESKKENGKVVTRYLGTKLEKRKNVPAAYLILAVSFFALFAVFFLVSEFNFSFTGHAVLSNGTSNTENISVDNNSISGGSVIAENETSEKVTGGAVDGNLVEINDSLILDSNSSVGINESLNETYGVAENNSIETNEATTEVEEGINNTEEVVNESVSEEVVEETNEIETIIGENNIATEENVTEVVNETIEVVESTNVTLKINTTQYPVVVGMPVKWKKKVSASNVTNNVSVKLPKEAENVVVYKIKNETLNGQEKVSKENVNSFSITGNVVGGGSGNVGFIDFFKNLFNKIRGAITGRVIDVQQNQEEVEVVIDDENATEYEIEYETPAPVAFEEQIENGKRVTISSDYHYENILAYSELPQETELSKIKLYHFNESSGEKILTDFDAYDFDGDLIVGETPEEKGYGNVSVGDLINVSNYSVNNNLVSFITWVVPHLSNQTYEIVIEISAAEHLDSNRVFIEDVYDKVSAQDNIWSSINSGEYVRVNFERSLASWNDITVYARSVGTNNASIGIYREDGNDLVAIINGINEEGFYKTYLTGLNETESYSTFDLKVLNSGIDFDYIVDPFYVNSSAPSSSNNVTVENNFTHLSLDHSGEEYAYFDGDGDYMQISGITFGVTDEWTLSTWVYDEGLTFYEFTFGKVGGGTPVIAFGTTTGFVWYRNVTGAYNTWDVGEDYKGAWHHFVFKAYGNNTLGLFYDSSFIGTVYSETNITITGIGKAYGTFQWNFNGSMDEIMIWNRSLSDSEISSLYTSNRTDSDVSSTNLVGYWSFDDDLNGQDSSGQGNDATFVNNTKTVLDKAYPYSDANGLVFYMPFDVPDGNGTWVTGNNSGGLDFDGVNDQIVIPDDDSLTAPGGITISGWVKSTDTSAVLVRKRLAAEQSYQLNVVTSNLWFTIDNGTGNIVKTTDSPTTDGEWHHFLGTWDGTNASIYVDGNYKVSATVLGSMSSTGQPLYLGGYDTLFLDGVLDEVRIFNRSVNSTEISELYNHNVINSTGLVGEWLLDDGESLVAEDTSGYRNHGDLTGYGADTRYVYDYSGNNVDGTIVNAIKYSSSGYFGGNYNFFNGIAGASPDYISLSDSDLLDISENKTFSTWFYPNDFHVNARIFSKSNAQNGWEVFSSTAGRITLRTYNSTGNYESYSNSVASQGSWNHIVVVLENGVPSFYINGNNEDNVIRTDHPLLGSAAVARLGTSFSSAGTYGINGRLDEIMIWNRSLSSTEITELYSNQSSRFYPTGEILFQGLNFSTNNTVNVTLDDCQTLEGTFLQGKINDGSYKDFSGCSFVDYELGSLSDLDNANFTVKLVSDSDLFYSPLVIGNITLGDYVTDQTLPTITFKLPTPDNNSYTDDSVLIRANVSDDSGENSSAWLDFDNSLVGYWAFDWYNSTGVYDNSSYSNFGTFQGTNFGSSNISNAIRGKGLDFDGVDNEVNMGNVNNLGTSDFSISFWMKQTTSSAGFIISKQSTNALGQKHFGVYTNSGKIIGNIDGTTQVFTTSTDGTSINDGSWHNVVVVFDRDDKIYRYIDGVSSGSNLSLTEITNLTNVQSFIIGARDNPVSYPFNGSLDDILIFNRTLSSDEIKTLYDSGSNEYFGNFSSLSSGQHDYTLYAMDLSGNLNISSRVFNVDTTAPSMTVNSPLNNSYASSNVKFDVDVSDSDFANTYTFINDSSLVGYWTFDTTNSTGVYDTSGNSNFGTFKGGIGEDNLSDGQFGNALDFDGSNDYVSLSSKIDTSTFSEWGAFAWVKYYDGSQSFGGIFGANALNVQTSTNKLNCYDGTTNIYSTGTLTEGVWTHVGITCDNSTNIATFYINGVNDSSQSLNCDYFNTYRVSIIGSFNGASLYWFNGSIDEAMIFNRSLSSEEVSALHNSTAQKFNVSYSLNSGLNKINLLSVDSGANQNSTILYVTNDTTLPVIEFKSPTPDNNSYTDDSVLIRANASDSSGGNSSAWLDFDNSLLGYWSFDNYNSTGVYDNSSYSSFGYFRNGLGELNLTEGARGKAFSFDGVDDQIELYDFAPTLVAENNWTISLWVYSKDSSVDQCAFATVYTGINFCIGVDSSGYFWGGIYDGSDYYRASTPVSTNEWKHLVFTNSNKAVHFYVDSVEVSDVNGAILGSGGTTRIGARRTIDGGFNGSIDDVMIFNRALSSDEVQVLYNSEANEYFGNFSSLSSGEHNYSVYAVDSAGNLNISSLRTFNVDTTAPSMAVNSPLNNSYASSNVKFDVDVSDSDFANTYTFINDSSLVSYFTFDTTNSTGVYDTSGNNNFGTFNNGVGENNLSDGQFGNALDFDGVDDYVDVSDNDNLDLRTSDKTITFWIKSPSLDSDFIALSKGGGYSTSLPGYTLRYANSRLLFQISSSTTVAYNAYVGTVQDFTDWTNVVVIIDRDDKAQVYYNGVLDGSSTSISGVESDDINVGDSFIVGSSGASRFLDGSIDEVMVFNRVLSQDEISALYNSTAQKFNVSYSLPNSGLNQINLLSIDSGANQNSTTLYVTNDEVAPVIEFELPTPNDGNHTKNNYVTLNTTITEDTGSDSSAWIDWNKSLLGYWSFDSYNSTGVYDNSSYSNFGTFNGGLGSYNLAQGSRGKGLSFDGSDDYVEIGQINFEEGNFTISAYIKVNAYSSTASTILGSASGGVSFFIANDGKLRLGEINIVNSDKSDGTVFLNTWTHVLVTFDIDTNNTKFYIDGFNAGNVTFNADFSPKSVKIGTWQEPVASSHRFNGTIDEIMIFNRSLSSSEILALYNNTANRLFNNFTNLTDGETYNYSVYAIDEAGNLNITSDRQVTSDVTEPLVTVALPVEGNTYTSSDVTFQVTTNEDSSCEYSIDTGSTNNSMTANSAGTIHTATQTGLSNANYVANYYCSDLAGNSNNTQNASFTVSVTEDTGGGGGSTGGGGGSVTVQTQPTIDVDIDSIERSLALNRIELGQIGISNTGTTSRTFRISVETINSIVEFENNTLVVGPGETGQFEYRLTPPKETGIYTGKIIITSTGFRQEIPITLNVKTETSLFDIIITIPKTMKSLSLGDNLEAQIDLLQMGIKEKLDVTLNYVIKDFEGKVYVVESETIAVTDQKTLQKEFHTEELPPGDYVLGTELIYPNGVAVASSQFKVKERIPLGGGNFVLYIAIGAFLVVFFVVFFIIRSYRRMLKKSKE